MSGSGCALCAAMHDTCPQCQLAEVKAANAEIAGERDNACEELRYLRSIPGKAEEMVRLRNEVERLKGERDNAVAERDECIEERVWWSRDHSSLVAQLATARAEIANHLLTIKSLRRLVLASDAALAAAANKEP